MATADDHLVQWKRNRRFAESIDSSYRDWQLTLVFYTALHAVTAAIVRLKMHCSDHTSRNEIVNSNDAFLGLRYQYAHLYRMSKVTRYDPDPDVWIPKKFLTIQDLADELLPPIENTVEQILGKKLGFQPIKLKT